MDTQSVHIEEEARVFSKTKALASIDNSVLVQSPCAR